ncbi:MAG TPA: hypothetical protein PK078_11385 [Anaerolineales bacterium]|nr:hypothetical protein [Anaerolineales bacterium]HNB37314.1 hypothetical protein [Anaerolineales bacterium]HNC09648.1 hypothetical protein [Anaerolineales bacterium]
MLGWFICAYRQAGSRQLPATQTSAKGIELAKWQASLSGLDWIEALVKEKKVIFLGGNGYPLYYTASFKELQPFLKNPPEARQTWAADPGDVLLPHWKGKTYIDQAGMDQCEPDEWLLVEVWDES